MALEPRRPGPDFFEGESDSIIALELLLNQRVGVERATAATLAIHGHAQPPFRDSEVTVAEATGWPYDPTRLRPTARVLVRVIAGGLAGAASAGRVRLGELPARALGALASLERYTHRENRAFDDLRAIALEPGVIRDLDRAAFAAITGLSFPAEPLRCQLDSATTVLAWKRSGYSPTRADLLSLPRVGTETADALLVYLFDQPSVIVDTYLRRISERHAEAGLQGLSRQGLKRLLGPLVGTREDARRLHARVNEIGVLHCRAEQPDCGACPLVRYPPFDVPGPLGGATDSWPRARDEMPRERSEAGTTPGSTEDWIAASPEFELRAVDADPGHTVGEDQGPGEPPG